MWKSNKIRKGVPRDDERHLRNKEKFNEGSVLRFF